jgi:hypothetical protein
MVAFLRCSSHSTESDGARTWRSLPCPLFPIPCDPPCPGAIYWYMSLASAMPKGGNSRNHAPRTFCKMLIRLCPQTWNCKSQCLPPPIAKCMAGPAPDTHANSLPGGEGQGEGKEAAKFLHNFRCSLHSNSLSAVSPTGPAHACYSFGAGSRLLCRNHWKLNALVHFALFVGMKTRASVLECGGPPPLLKAPEHWRIPGRFTHFKSAPTPSPSPRQTRRAGVRSFHVFREI